MKTFLPTTCILLLSLPTLAEKGRRSLRREPESDPYRHLGSSKSKSKSSKGGGYCTCASCTTDALNSMAGQFTCGARINYLMEEHANTFGSSRKACRRVGGLEFPQGTPMGSELPGWTLHENLTHPAIVLTPFNSLWQMRS